MGVHGLWDLLAPVGRRVSVETLAGKRLAIDASIWMVQFMKAMRDERGEMVRNAHVLGFFRRICKLLFLRTKPVFVFDGGTPALKRRTVIARRRQRENAQAKIRKTAEKMLLNQVNAMKLKQLDDNLQDQKDMNNSKGKEVLLDESDILKKTDAALEGHQEMIDEMLAASIQAEESGDLGTISSCVADIGSSSGNVSASSAAAFPQVDEEDESDEEMILPITDGNVDPAVLAALPPSMQLDLLVQMRERLMAENRQKYQKVKKAPKKFSELQIEAYLKTVAFRREIDQVQKAAAGKGVGGVQTSRIASETNREFIFSTSFSGDKQLLASGEAEKISEIQPMKEKKDSFFDILKAMASATKSTPEAEPAVDEAVQAFIDERRHRRVSSRRAMGIRMTRDLQRNIDLMKELEQESENHNIEANNQINLDMEGHLVESLCNGKSLEAVDDINCDIVQNSIVHSSLELKSHKDALMSDTFIEISFEDDMEQRSLDGDDEVFAHLVAGEQLPICSADNTTSGCEWEDGMISGESESLVDGNELGTNSLHVQYQNTNEFDVEWEDGTSLMSDKCNVKSLTVEDSKYEEIGEEWQDGTAITDIHGNASDVQKTVSKGSVEEAAALQEAIRRSLEDSTGGKSNSVSFDQKADDYACNSQLQLDGCSLLPCSYLERVLDGRQQSQYPVNEYDHSNFIAGKNTCSMHSTSGASVVTGPVPPIDKNDFNELQFSTSTGNALVSNLSKNGFSDLTDVATGGPATPHKSNVDAITNDRTAPTCDSGIVSEYSVGQTSFLEKQAVHSDLKKTVANDGSGHVSMQERSHDVEISASKDEDKTYESMGFSLEDELLVLDQEYKNLGDEQKRLGRNADSVNAEMFVECQELLQMFGLPYIIAPMEAEAQCAYMELANLVDGVVTDDSDVFLFGAQNVYKNIFDDRKYVETYFMKDIESELGLNREKLIRMALLLGSDYTEGVSGIGIVNAIEVLNAFPEEDGFHKFREWIESPDPSILGKVNGLSSKKKGSKASKNGMSKSKSDVEGNSDSDILLEHEDNDTRNALQNMRQTFMNKHRNVSKNWHLPVSFPSDAVISAYAAPQVDKSTEPFAWGKPDIFSLRRLCWEKLGWANQKADELLLPVLKEYNKHETQLRLEAFYTFNERFAKIRSKRIKQAVKGITGKKSLNLDKGDDLLENPAKLKRTEAPASGNKSKRSLLKTKDRVAGERNNNSAQKLKSQQEKGNKGLPTEVESMGLCTGAFTKSISNTGRSRVRGRGKRTAVGRGQQKEHSDSECDETILHDQSSNSDEHEHEVLAENMELPDSVRRSKRARKAANYLEEDEESDEVVTPPNRMNGNCSDDRTGGQTSPQCLSVHGADVANAREERESTFEDLPGHRVPEDYLVTGGGFCAEEDKAEIESNQLANLGSTQRDTAIVDADSVYLQMGGGFCVDDDDDLDIGEGDGGVASTYTDACVSTTFTRTEESGLTIDPCEIATAPESVPATVEGLRKGPLLDSKLTLGYNNQTTDGNMSTVAPPTNKAAPTSVNPFSSLPIFKRKKKKVKKP